MPLRAPPDFDALSTEIDALSAGIDSDFDAFDARLSALRQDMDQLCPEILFSV